MSLLHEKKRALGYRYIFFSVMLLALLVLALNHAPYAHAAGGSLETAPHQAVFIIGENKYTIDGKTYSMDVAPLLQNGRTYLPVRFVAEAFGYEVTWDACTNSVLIIPPEELPLSPGMEDIGEGKPAGRVETGRDLGGGTDTTKPTDLPMNWVE